MIKKAHKQKSVEYPKLVNDKGSLTQIEKQFLGNFIALSGGSVILEFGIYKGVTTKYICEFLLKNNIKGKVYGFDIPSVIDELKKDHELIRFLEMGMLEFVPGWLPNSLKSWLREHDDEINLVLDDALHDYTSVYNELKLTWPRLAKDGFIICHDYVDHFEGVTYAIDKFSKKKNVHMLPIISSDKARGIGYASVIVGLRKKEYSRSIFSILEQEFYPYKKILANSKLWQKYIKPIIR